MSDETLPEGFQYETQPAAPEAASVELPPGFVYEAPAAPPSASRVLQDPAAQAHEERVQRYLPQEREIVGRTPSFLPGIVPPEVPIVSPLARRIGAAAVSSLGLPEGNTFGERYSNSLAEDEARRRALAERYPTASIVSDVAGTIGGAAATPALGIQAAASRIASVPILGRLASYAGTGAEGALYGGAEAALRAPPGASAESLGHRAAEGAAEGAAFGVGARGALSFLTPERLAALRNIVNPAGRAESRVAREAARAPQSPTTLTPEQFEAARAQGLPVTPAYLQGAREVYPRAMGLRAATPEAQDLQRHIYDLHTGRTVTFQNELDNIMTRPREGGPSIRVEPAHPRIEGTHPANLRPTTMDADALRYEAETLAREMNRPAYQRAFSNPAAQNIWTPELERLTSGVHGQEAINTAINNLTTRAAFRDQPFNNPFVRSHEGAPWELQRNASVNLEFWDEFRKNLDAQYQRFRVSGLERTPEAIAVLEARQNTQNLLSSIVPEYGAAVDTARRYITAGNAFDAGANFFNLANSERGGQGLRDLGRQMRAFRSDFSPEEQRQFAYGLASFMRSNPDDAARVFSGGNQATMARYREVLGPERFDEIRNLALVTNAARNLQGLTVARTALSEYGPHMVPAIGGAMIGWLHGVSPGSVGAQVAGHAALALRHVRHQNEARELVNMMLDPAQIGNVAELVGRSARHQQTLNQLQPILSRMAAQQADADERPRRAAGGRIGKNYRAKAQALILAAERAKKQHNKTTEPILGMADEAVAKALSLANDAI